MNDASLSLCIQIVSRQAAKVAGLSNYFSGKPCKYGHVSQRSVCSSNCLECLVSYRQKPEVKEKVRQAMRDRYQTPDGRQAAADSAKKYHRRNRDVILEKMKARNSAYYQANKERIKHQVGEYQASRPKERRAYKAVWERKARRTRPEYAARATMRKLVARVCERIQMKRRDAGGTESALGYTTLEFKVHIERQFLAGMSWDNRSDWHVDHIYPLVSFDLSCEKERRAANALSNLRPMWAEDNMTKGSIIMTLL